MIIEINTLKFKTAGLKYEKMTKLNAMPRGLAGEGKNRFDYMDQV